jgi:hypothetical protein
MLAIFDMVNVAMQSSAASKVRVVRAEMLQLLRRVLSIFVQPGEIRAAGDLTNLEFTDAGKQVLDERSLSLVTLP